MKLISFFSCCIMFFSPDFLEAQQLHVSSSAGLRMTSSGPLQMVFNNSDFVNNGDFNAQKAGTIIFTRNKVQANTVIGGNGSSVFNNLVLDTKSSNLQLDNNISITGNLVMQSGNLLLNDRVLDLGSTGSIIGERNDSRITGANGGLVTVTAALRSPQKVNPGNIGVEISSQSDLGTTLISRGHLSQVGKDGEHSIDRYFDIMPEYNSGLDASIRFYYLDAEIGNSSKEMLSVFTRQGKSGSWSVKGKDGNNTSLNWVVKNHLDNLDNYTLARSFVTPLAKLGAYQALQVFPNPYIDHFSLAFDSDEEKDDMVSLYDQVGHLLQLKKIHLTKGANTVDWVEGKFAAGTYYLSFTNKGERKVLKIVKL